MSAQIWQRLRLDIALCLLFALGVCGNAASGAAPSDDAEVSGRVRACHDGPINSNDIKKAEGVIAACTDALKIPDLKPEVRALLLNDRGVALRNAKRIWESLVDLKAAAAAAPGDASVHRMLAWSYRTMGLSNEAEGALTRSLELEVHWQGYLSRCGVRTDLRRYKEALGDCEAAHKLIKNEDTYYFTALMRADDGQLGEAILLLKEATKSSYASGRLYGLLADIYRREGQKSEAAAVEAEGRKAFPEDPSLKAPPPQE